jgi:hypothetical protein
LIISLSLLNGLVKKKHIPLVNIISSAMTRGLWLTMNDFVFNNQVWSDVRMVLKRI